MHIIGIVVTVTLVTVHDFTFQLSMRSFTHLEDFATMKRAASATAVRTGDSKRNGNQLICRCFNSHQRYDIKASNHLSCDLSDITQLGDWCMDT